MGRKSRKKRERAEATQGYFWDPRHPGEQTPIYLGRVLDELGFAAMARRARQGHFDDFFAPPEVADGMEILRLHNELREKVAAVSEENRWRVRQVIEAVEAGEFDATKAESARWAASKEGQDTFRALLEGR